MKQLLKKRVIWIAATVILLLATTVGVAASLRGGAKPTFYYFYEEVCGSCDGTRELYDQIEQKMSDLAGQAEYELVCVNTFTDNSDRWKRACDEAGVPEEARLLPMVIHEKDYIAGDTRVKEELRPFFFRNLGVPDHRTIYYFYRPPCGDCERIAPFMEEITKKYSEFQFVRIDTTDPEPKAKFKQELAARGIPEEEWQVPFLWNDEDYLAGDKSIEANLEQFLTDILEKSK